MPTLADICLTIAKQIADGHLSPGYGVAMHELDPNRQRIAMRTPNAYLMPSSAKCV